MLYHLLNTIIKIKTRKQKTKSALAAAHRLLALAPALARALILVIRRHQQLGRRLQEGGYGRHRRCPGQRDHPLQEAGQRFSPHLDELLAEAEDRRRRRVDNASRAPRYLVVVDFECTCEENTWSYLHEVIEFPVVLVDTSTKQIVDTFHRYVRPTENATLTKFCSELTGIDQEQVDGAAPIDTVLHELDDWLRSKDLVDGAGATHDFTKFAFATDGWDLDHFLDVECRRKGLYKPGPTWTGGWTSRKSLRKKL